MTGPQTAITLTVWTCSIKVKGAEAFASTTSLKRMVEMSDTPAANFQKDEPG